MNYLRPKENHRDVTQANFVTGVYRFLERQLFDILQKEIFITVIKIDKNPQRTFLITELFPEFRIHVHF
jgi:hypothetical protein